MSSIPRMYAYVRPSSVAARTATLGVHLAPHRSGTTVTTARADAPGASRPRLTARAPSTAIPGDDASNTSRPSAPPSEPEPVPLSGSPASSAASSSSSRTTS